MKNYEMLYIISGDVTDTDVESKAKLASKVIEEARGKVKNMDISERKTLAYHIKNQDTGTYVNLIFELDPQKIETIKKEFKTLTFVIRYIISIIPDRKSIIKLKPKKAKKEEVETEKADASGTDTIKTATKPEKEIKKSISKTAKKKDEVLEKKPSTPEKPKNVIVSKAKKTSSKPEKSLSKTQDKTEITQDIENEEKRLKKLDEKLEEILKD